MFDKTIDLSRFTNISWLQHFANMAAKIDTSKTKTVITIRFILDGETEHYLNEVGDSLEDALEKLESSTHAHVVQMKRTQQRKAKRKGGQE